jgi:hypothetical protein
MRLTISYSRVNFGAFSTVRAGEREQIEMSKARHIFAVKVLVGEKPPTVSSLDLWRSARDTNKTG